MYGYTPKKRNQRNMFINMTNLNCFSFKMIFISENFIDSFNSSILGSSCLEKDFCGSFNKIIMIINEIIDKIPAIRNIERAPK